MSISIATQPADPDSKSLWLCVCVCECWRVDLQCWVHRVGGWGGEMRSRGRVREREVQEEDSQENSGWREKRNACQSTPESHQSTVFRHTHTRTRSTHTQHTHTHTQHSGLPTQGQRWALFLPLQLLFSVLFLSVPLSLWQTHWRTPTHKTFSFLNEFWPESFTWHQDWHNQELKNWKSLENWSLFCGKNLKPL